MIETQVKQQSTWEKYKVDVPAGQSGKWTVEKFTVPENDWRALGYALHGRPVLAGEYTRLMNGGYSPMMSDTPAEIKDHLPFIHRATGDCLINGLGLGMCLKAIMDKPEVTHIDVVEMEQDVINLVWATYSNNPKITLHHANALEIEWGKGKRWDCAWHDIWQDICADNIPEMIKLKRKYGHRVRWQGVWCEYEARHPRF